MTGPPGGVHGGAHVGQCDPSVHSVRTLDTPSLKPTKANMGGVLVPRCPQRIWRGTELSQRNLFH